MAQPVGGTLGEISSSPSPPSLSSPSASSTLSPSSIATCSIPPVAFSDKSTNSGLEAGELFPILHINSKSYEQKSYTVTTSIFISFLIRCESYENIVFQLQLQ